MLFRECVVSERLLHRRLGELRRPILAETRGVASPITQSEKGRLLADVESQIGPPLSLHAVTNFRP